MYCTVTVGAGYTGLGQNRQSVIQIKLYKQTDKQTFAVFKLIAQACFVNISCAPNCSRRL